MMATLAFVQAVAALCLARLRLALAEVFYQFKTDLIDQGEGEERDYGVERRARRIGEG